MSSRPRRHCSSRSSRKVHRKTFKVRARLIFVPPYFFFTNSLLLAARRLDRVILPHCFGSAGSYATNSSSTPRADSVSSFRRRCTCVLIMVTKGGGRRRLSEEEDQKLVFGRETALRCRSDNCGVVNFASERRGGLKLHVGFSSSSSSSTGVYDNSIGEGIQK